MVLNRVLTLFHRGGWTGLNLTLCTPNTHMCMGVVKIRTRKKKKGRSVAGVTTGGCSIAGVTTGLVD